MTPSSPKDQLSSGHSSLPSRKGLVDLTKDLRERTVFEAEAFSADGRVFAFEAPLSAEVQLGGWVALVTESGARYLGQVTAQSVAMREGANISLDLNTNVDDYVEGGRISQAGIRMRIRYASGSGTILARQDGRKLVATNAADAFAHAGIEAAEGSLVAAYLAGVTGDRVRLPIGVIQRCADAPDAFVRAAGFDRHTFLCGQSGSGKTYALGMLLEQLLLHTDLDIVIIDANSDYVRLGDIRSEIDAVNAGTYRKRSRGLAVFRPAPHAVSDRLTLRIWFSDLAEVEQAAILQLNPLADGDAYAALSTLTGSFDGKRFSLDDVLMRARASDDDGARQLALRMQNLRVADWAVWAHGRERSTTDVIGDKMRAIVLDVGTLASAPEKAVVAAALLGGLWRNRERRRPRLIVIDEAHNFCAGDPQTMLHKNAVEYCINIAGEGRKFGLYLLLSTQRPQKIHTNVLSQCDNLMLMRMNSLTDLAELSGAFSFVSPTLLEEAVHFRQGEALIAGRITPAPLIARLARRISEEGGADIPTTWARKAR